MSIVASEIEKASAAQPRDAWCRALIEQARDCIAVLSPDGSVRYANPSMRAVIGGVPPAQRGADAFGELHPDDAASARMAFASLAEEPGGETRIGFRVAGAAGGWLTFDVRAQNFSHEPRIDGVVVVARQVSDPAASHSTADRIQFQARLLDAVGQAVIAIDLRGRITYWNRASEELHGWSTQEALGRDAVQLLGLLVEPAVSDELIRTLRGGQNWTGEFRVRRRDGSVFTALATNAPILDGAGALAGIISVSADISERLDLEAQLRQAQKIEAVGRLAGGIAHDFNNLLTAINGHASVLLDELPEDSEIYADIRQIHRAGERAAALTRQLLAFSRKQVLEARSIDLLAAALELEPMLRRLVPERIELEVELIGARSLVWADPGQLTQVLLNLVVNAVDAIPETGWIRLRVDSIELTPADAERMPWQVRTGRFARIGVHDSGTGISDAVRQRIFEPFFTTKPEGMGTGLGLSTVYGIVKQSGGHILVDSAPGRGTSFDVLLPAADVEPVDTALVAASTDTLHSGGVVLVVEDDETVTSLARRVLVRAGYTVLEAADGRDALAVMDRHKGAIDLVLTDVVMPRMGGVELTRILRERHPHLRVLLTSGYSEAELRGEVRTRGDGFLVKPFTPDALLELVANTLDTVR